MGKISSLISSTVGKYLLDRLQQHGVQHIFGLPGDYVLRLDKMIEEEPSFQFINATRENTAGYMADAYARIRGLGAVCITYGVGINITNAISQAYVESSPVVLISGAPATGESRNSPYLHHLIPDTTQLEIFKHITVDQAILSDPETAQQEIDRVLESCLRYKKPVYLELPRNIIAAEISPTPSKLLTESSCDPKKLARALQRVRTLLQHSKRPILWIGHEVQRFGLASRLIDFAEQHRIPIATTLLGKTIVNEHHPLFIGVYQGKISRPEVSQFVENSDCFLVIGAILSDMDTGMFTAQIKDDKSVLANADRLIIAGEEYSEIPLTSFLEALSELSMQKFEEPKFPKKRSESFSANRKPITVGRMFECLQTYLKPEHMVVADIGDALFGSVDLMLSQNSFLACSYFGSLGFAVPGAIGAQIASPKRRIIAIVGDGAFQMTGTELSTAVRYHLDPVIILLNNRGYGTERPLLEGHYNDIVNWNYTELPKLLGGGNSIRVSTEEEFAKVIKPTLEKRGSFTLIEVEIGKQDFSPTMQRFIKVATKKIRD